jgi:hypothetical protein
MKRMSHEEQFAIASNGQSDLVYHAQMTALKARVGGMQHIASD